MLLKRPMLAGKFDLTKLQFPVYVQPKLDGFRCLAHLGCAISRTLKPLPNRYIQHFFAKYQYLHGLDGEIMVGHPTATETFRNTQSGVMSEAGNPAFLYYVFDMWDNPHFKYAERKIYLEAVLRDPEDPFVAGVVKIVETTLVNSLKSLEDLEAHYVELGYEGVILRSPHGFYKAGRSTSNEGWLIKLKRFEDAEATIIGFEELMSNQNEATKDELGLTKRSSHKANMVPENTLGKLQVRNAKGQEFGVGSGFDVATRQEIWANRDKWLGKIITYRYPIADGGYDKPRHAVYKGLRAEIDHGE